MKKKNRPSNLFILNEISVHWIRNDRIELVWSKIHIRVKIWYTKYVLRLTIVPKEWFSVILYIFTIFDTKTASKSALEWAENPGVNCFRLSGSSTTENKIENFWNFSSLSLFTHRKTLKYFFWKWKLLKKIFPRIRKWTKNYKCKRLNSGN